MATRDENGDYMSPEPDFSTLHAQNQHRDRDLEEWIFTREIFKREQDILWETFITALVGLDTATSTLSHRRRRWFEWYMNMVTDCDKGLWRLGVERPRRIEDVVCLR
jgi:hypothetical protein